MTITKNNNVNILGVMSGTSLDGLDLCLCHFSDHTSVKILVAETIEYTAAWKNKLANAHLLSGYELSLLDREFGRFIGENCIAFLKKHAVEADYISSHGHTVFHEPHNHLTVQIGHGASIYAMTSINTICDFRTVDVALGGEGAPLVPVGDHYLFSDYSYCLNLGGIANVSYNNEGKRIAYDLCPANMALNYVASRLGKSYDKDGLLTQQGTIISELYNELNRLDFYKQTAPKSLGREWFETTFAPLISDKYKVEDLLYTICRHIAFVIAADLKEKASGNMIITGGGTFHPVLVNCIKEALSNHIEVIIPDNDTINFKEAMIFAYLGYLKLQSSNNVLASVTGSIRDNIGGVIYG